MNHTRLGLTVALLSGLSAGALAQPSYDTEAAWTGFTVGILGAGHQSAFGQSFLTPIGGYTTLKDFSFWVESDSDRAGTDSFVAQVFQYDGAKPVGAALYTDDLGTKTFGHGFTEITMNTDVSLTPGGQYVALLTDTTNQSDFALQLIQGHTAGDGGGQMVWNLGGWAFAGNDIGWHADFSPSGSPEPFTIGLGIAGLGLGLRRRMRARFR